MNAIRSFQAGFSLSCVMRIATVLLVAVAAGCGGGYGGGGGGGGMATSARPTITQQPTNQTVTAPNAATFTVVATGATGGYGGGSLTYQWMMNGSPIMGATMASYSTGMTTSGQTATLFVAVTNGNGTTDSNMVTLTVM